MMEDTSDILYGTVAASLKAMPQVHADADFTRRVLDAVHADAKREWRMRRLSRTVMLPLAACAVAVFAFASIFLQPLPPKPSLAPYVRTASVRIYEYSTADWFRPLNIADLAEPTAACLLHEAEMRISATNFPACDVASFQEARP